MVSHSPYTHQGPGPSSYFQTSPSTHHAYGSHSPGRRPNYHSYPPPPHMAHPYQHPVPSRGSQRGGHANSAYHYHLPYHPASQQPPYPHVSPLTVHPVHHQQNAGQPTPYSSQSTKYNPSYSPSYHYPSPTAPVFTPSWQAQPISPLPKQLSTPLPHNIRSTYDSSQTPQSELSPVPQSYSNAPAEQSTTESVSGLPTPPATTEVKPTGEPDTTDPPVDEPASPTAAPDSTVEEPLIQISSLSYSQMGTIPAGSSVQPSLMTSTNPVAPWAIWSRRPRDPSQAPSIIISPKARPPSDIVQQALDLQTPPLSPSPVSETSLIPIFPAKDVDASLDSTTNETANIWSSQTNSTVPSSSVTESTDTPAASGSPVSSHTSVSIACTPAKNSIEVPTHAEEHGIISVVTSVSTSTGVVTAKTSSESVTVSTDTVSSTTHISTSDDSATTVQPPQPTVTASPPPAVPKKSWASLLRNSSSHSQDPSRNALPTSSVVGFSIPAANTSVSVPPSHKSDLMALLTTGPSGFSAVASPKANSAMKIRPRGLMNSGNMCFANAVLQILVYCPPFHKLFAALGQLLVDSNAKDLTGKFGISTSTPFVNATAVFIQEFMDNHERKAKKLEVVSKGGINGSSGSNIRSGGKGKEREFKEEKPGEDDYEGESFLPTYVYDAMKTKKRFDTMRGGHQEDAEEFLGFYLDTLEEELLSILHVINPPQQGKGSSAAPVEEKEEAALSEDGWLEVGKRNRTIVTRTIKAAESPITKIFGGKFRSALRAPGQKDSVIVEDWRSLRLDIQRDQIHTIQDALSHISHPQPVQVTHPTRTGVILEAQQQVLIDALPPILVLHIKRFYYDTAVGGVAKVSKHVRYGPELVIGSDIMVSAIKKTQSIRYKLFGALYHHGHSASGGHYTLDVLHPNRYLKSSKPQEGWIRIDDELISDVRPEDVFSAPEKDDTRCAYLLFYRRI